MYLFSSPAVVLFCVFVGAQLEVDYRVLKPCERQIDCFPWQECADCKYTNVDLQFGYCSDVSPRNDPRGLCANNYFSSPQDSEGYKDGHFKCHCQRNVPPFTLSDSEPCGMDADCAGLENRCATCMTNAATKEFHNFCTGETPGLDSYYSCQNPACSCGQRRGKSETSANDARPGVGHDAALFDNPWIPQSQVDAQPAAYEATNPDPPLFASANVAPQFPDVEPSFQFDAQPYVVQPEEDPLPIFT